MLRSARFSSVVVAGFTAMVMSLPACAPRNPHETGGFLRPLALQRACISGKVTDAVTGRGIDGAVLVVEPADAGPHVTTNRDGFFYAEFTGGSYSLRFVKNGYRATELTILLSPGETAGKDISLEPTAPVIIDAGKPVISTAPGSTVMLKATVTIR